jgi:hypothetical protein
VSLRAGIMICGFACIVSLDIYVLAIQIVFCEVLHTAQKFSPCISLNTPPPPTKFVDFSYIYICFLPRTKFFSEPF